MSEIKSRGVIYIAFGLPYLYMTFLSIKTLVHFNPDLPILIITNVPETEEMFNKFENVKIHFVSDTDKNNRNYKTSLINYSPFDLTLYLDCDTIIMAPIHEAYDYLNYFDLCIKQKSKPYKTNEKGKEIVPHIGKPVHELASWNGGVLFFNKNKAVINFFANWHRYYSEAHSNYDQTSLVAAIYKTDVKILSLEERWNCFCLGELYKNNGKERVIVLHYASRFNSNIKSNLKIIEKFFLDKFSYRQEELGNFFKLEQKARIKKIGIFKFILEIFIQNVLQLIYCNQRLHNFKINLQEN